MVFAFLFAVIGFAVWATIDQAKEYRRAHREDDDRFGPVLKPARELADQWAAESSTTAWRVRSGNDVARHARRLTLRERFADLVRLVLPMRPQAAPRALHRQPAEQPVEHPVWTFASVPAPAGSLMRPPPVVLEAVSVPPPLRTDEEIDAWRRDLSRWAADPDHTGPMRAVRVDEGLAA
ncbi:hypothetical protein [Micromonospora pisi]|uniref:hypothetical protein n=1 Tax=Micromonospora pisi TaxID=589240 RepID=UPI000EB1318F|nr:hypothetical protein [Micromonospora pisi]